MSSLPERIALLNAEPKAEPWVRFMAQCIEQQRSCVLVTVLECPPGSPCEGGERFVYDADGHGLLPRDIRFSIALHRLTQLALQEGAVERISVGEIALSLSPFCP